MDNGRSAEFIRRKDYPDKSRCYECGEEGHLSYECARNTLGRRTPPPKKIKSKKKRKHNDDDDDKHDSDVPDYFDSENSEDETLSFAIKEAVG